MTRLIPNQMTVRNVTKFIARRSVSVTCIRIAYSHTTPEDTFATKAQLYTGGMVVGAMAADHVDALVDKIFDETIDAWRNMKQGTDLSSDK